MTTYNTFMESFEELYNQLNTLDTEQRDSGLKMLGIMYLNLEADTPIVLVNDAIARYKAAHKKSADIEFGLETCSKLWPVNSIVKLDAERLNLTYNHKGKVLFSTDTWAKVLVTERLSGGVWYPCPEHTMCFTPDEMRNIYDC